MKLVHTQKKSANRPFAGVSPTFRYNFANSFKDGRVGEDGVFVHKSDRANHKRSTAAYRRAVPLN